MITFIINCMLENGHLTGSSVNLWSDYPPILVNDSMKIAHLDEDINQLVYECNFGILFPFHVRGILISFIVVKISCLIFELFISQKHVYGITCVLDF